MMPLTLTIVVGLSLGLFSSTRCDTRYSCFERRMTGMYNFGMYERDSSSSEEIEDLEEGSSLMRGTLSCADVTQARILVTKVIHGNGGFFASCGSPNEHCDRTVFTMSTVAEMCDRKTTCTTAARSIFLPRCGLMSNFIHVEYECVNPWSVFDICHDVTTTAKTSKIYAISPPLGTPKASKCECILKPMEEVDIIVDYVHSNTDDRDCDINYLLIESKSSPNQTNVDEQTKVCGRKHFRKSTYRGSLRFTYGTRSRFLNDGFIARISASGKSDMEVQCGTVFLPGDDESFRGPPPRRPMANPYRARQRRFRQSYRDFPIYRRYMTTVSPPFQGPYSNFSSQRGGPWESRWDRQRTRNPNPREQPTFNKLSPNADADPDPPERPERRNARQPPSPPRSRSYRTTVSPFDLFRRDRNRNLDLFYEGPRRGRNSDFFYDGPRRNRNLDLFYDGPRRWGPTTPPLRSDKWSRNGDYPAWRDDKFGKRQSDLGATENGTNATKPIPKLDSSFFSSSNNTGTQPEVKLPAKVEFIGRSATKRLIKSSDSSVSSILSSQPIVSDGDMPPPPPPSLNKKLAAGEKAGQQNGKTTEQFIAYIMAGVGVVLIAFGAIYIVFRFTRRRKLAKEVNFRRTGLCNGRSIEDEPVYTLPTSRAMPPIPEFRSHVNCAYVDTETSVAERPGSPAGQQPEDEDPYSSVCIITNSDINNPCYMASQSPTVDECVGTSSDSGLATSNLYDNNI